MVKYNRKDYRVYKRKRRDKRLPIYFRPTLESIDENYVRRRFAVRPYMENIPVTRRSEVRNRNRSIVRQNKLFNCGLRDTRTLLKAVEGVDLPSSLLDLLPSPQRLTRLEERVKAVTSKPVSE